MGPQDSVRVNNSVRTFPSTEARFQQDTDLPRVSSHALSTSNPSQLLIILGTTRILGRYQEISWI
jgi:hypothetical protein